MDEIKKKNHYNKLLSVYGNTLSNITLKDMKDHYEDDLSLSEIAINRNVSRNAVFLSIKQGEKELDNLEKELHFVESLEKKTEELEQVLLNPDLNNERNKLERIIEELKNGI